MIYEAERVNPLSFNISQSLSVLIKFGIEVPIGPNLSALALVILIIGIGEEPHLPKSVTYSNICFCMPVILFGFIPRAWIGVPREPFHRIA